VESAARVFTGVLSTMTIGQNAALVAVPAEMLAAQHAPPVRAPAGALSVIAVSAKFKLGHYQIFLWLEYLICPRNSSPQ
jgi:hypothetical protein